MIEEITAKGMSYLFVAKPSSHKYLFEWLTNYPCLNNKTVVDENNTIHKYEWMNEVPLNGGKDSVTTNFFQYRIIKTNKKGRQKTTYKNSWVTDLKIDDKNIEKFKKNIHDLIENFELNLHL